MEYHTPQLPDRSQLVLLVSRKGFKIFRIRYLLDECFIFDPYEANFCTFATY